MKIEQINSKLKHKIIQIELASKPNGEMNEDDKPQIEIQKGDQQNNVAFVQLSDKWMKFVLKGSSNTYLVEYSKLADLIHERFERSRGLPDDAFIEAAKKWANDTESIVEVKSGYLENDNDDDLERKIQNVVGNIQKYLSDVATMFNSSNSGIVPGQELPSLVQVLNSPYKLDAKPIENYEYYVVIVNKTPYAVVTDGAIKSGDLKFTKVIDPMIWFGTLLEGEGNIDEPNVPLGITA